MMLRNARAAIIGILAMILISPAPVFAQGTGVSLEQSQSDPDAPLEVTSDALSVDRETGNAIFTGNVFAKQGSLTLSADKVEVLYDEEDGTIPQDDDGVREIIATGSVIFVNGPDVAEGEYAVYNPREDSIVMTGNVLLTQGRTIISGDRLVADLETGQGNMEGRVKTVLRPRGEASE